MRIQVSTDLLQQKIGVLNHVISSKNHLPILLNILLETQKKEVKLSATDLEIGIQIILPATIEEEGGITIPARAFIELITNLPSETITLFSNGETLEVISKKTSSLFQTIPKEEYPELFKEKGEILAEFYSEEFKNDLTSVIFAASLDVMRPALSGVYLKQENKKGYDFLLVATDGYRLSLKQHKREKKGGEEVQKDFKDEEEKGKTLVIPVKVFKELVGTKGTGEKTKLYVSHQQNQVIFEQEDIVIIGRLLEEAFPNYEKILPSEHSVHVAFEREELQKAVKICSIFARDSANIVRLSVRKESIVVSSNTPSVGKNTVAVDAKVTGEENEIAFNARYLLDFLGTIEANELFFEMTGPLNPGVFKIKDDPSFLHLIMPIRVQG